jgi:Acetyltransferase (GNAT) domain
VWPRFMRARTLMVGCSAGEGHLDAGDMLDTALAEALAGALPRLARELSCVMVVLKEFPARYRPVLACLSDAGFTRIPSMPMTKLALPYKNFDDYVRSKLSATTRATLRRKLRVCARAQPPVTLEVMHDASRIVDEIHPLYLNVFARSALQFEKLTREFLAEIGARIPDKTRFFVWRQGGRAVAFALCLVDDNDVYHEYVGFDYAGRAQAAPLLSRVPRHHRMGDRQRLSRVPQRQPQLRSEMALAPGARSDRSLRAPHLGAD